MADKQELEIKIDDDGNVTIKVIGGKGTSCVDITKDIENALGIVVDRQKTSEYYQEQLPIEKQVEKKGGG